MKIILLLTALSSYGSDFSVGDWQCKAEGYDRFRQRWEAESDRHLVIWEAERDALAKCQELSLNECRVFYCSDSN